MTAHLPSPEFENEVRAAMSAPGISNAFSATLRRQLQAAAATRVDARPQRGFRPARALALGMAALCLVLLLAIGPERVLAQVAEWLKFIPGIGFVEDEHGLRVLAEPVSQTRDGITVTIEQAVVDDKHTWITYFFEGIPDDLRPATEDDPGCFSYPLLLLPDGRILNIEAGTGGGGYTWTREQYAYPAIPANISEVTAWLPCVPGVRRDEGPQNWEVKIHFVAAPEDYEILPVIPLTTQTQEAAPEVTPETLHGVVLSAENLVELENGYLIQGSVNWTQSEYPQIYFNESMLSVTDANGDPILVEPIYNDLSMQSDRRIAAWSLQTNRKDINSPLTIHLKGLITHYELGSLDEPRFIFDFGDHPRDGQTWDFHQVLTIGETLITFRSAEFSVSQDDHYQLSLTLEIERDLIASVGMRDLNISRLMMDAGGYGGGGFAQADTEYLVVIGYDYLPTGLHHFQVDSLNQYLEGEWTTKVELPENGVQMTEPQQENSCITPDAWSGLLALPTRALPDDINTGIALIERSVGALLPNLSLIRADGSLVADLGLGSWGSVSPDGSKVAYAYNGLRVFDIASKQTSLLISEDSSYNMAWSPDGTRLALIRGGAGVYLIDANGANLHTAPGSSPDMIGIAGWMPDGQRLVVARISSEGTLVQTLNVETGTLQDNFVIDNLKGGFTHLSPDGSRIAFSSSVFGAMNYGLYVADLDGNNRRLIAEPGETIMFTLGAWRPDGDSLILNPYQVAAFDPEPQHPLVVHLDTCAVDALDALLGQVKDWR